MLDIFKRKTNHTRGDEMKMNAKNYGRYKNGDYGRYYHLNVSCQ